MRPAKRPRFDHRRRAAALATAALVLTLAAGCGGDPAGSAAVGEVRAGSVAALADCAAWRAGSVDERLATIAEARSQVGRAAGGRAEPLLSDADAYSFLERACAPEYAASFRLYKLLNRAASFSRLGS